VAPIFTIYNANYESFILTAATERWKVKETSRCWASFYEFSD